MNTIMQSRNWIKKHLNEVIAVGIVLSVLILTNIFV